MKLYVWKERAFNLSLLQQIPIYLSQERMVFDLVYAVETQPVLWLSLNKSIDEVNALFTPAIGRDFIEKNLLG